LVAIKNIDNPESALDLWLAECSYGDEIHGSQMHSDRVMAVEYAYSQYYLPQAPVISLLVIYCQSADKVLFSVMAASASARDQLQNTVDNLEGFSTFVQHNHLPVFELGQPLRLETVCIAKPWGQEIWYTGIEERGVSLVSDGVESVPLPWVLSVAPKRIAANRERQINLLKILDPLPEEVYGDLYFELHEEKREVYVVTHIDKQAWPDGVGAIRYGFDSHVRNEYVSEQAFKSAYLDVVKHYQSIRRKIDQQLDSYRQAENIGQNEPVSAEVMKRWVAMLPSILIEQEQEAREEMNRFTSLLPLQQGDVVKVPLLTPHSLQHGVRTVEFQTPVYERMILSFAQKVLTQSHWDTEKAVDLMSVDCPQATDLVVLEESDGHRLEEVVQFDDFEVLRLRLGAKQNYFLESTQGYGLLMIVEGEAVCQGRELVSEDALMLPAERNRMNLVNKSDQDVSLLLAYPIVAKK